MFEEKLISLIYMAYESNSYNHLCQGAWDLLMGLTKLTTDEVIRDDGTRFQKKGLTSAYSTNKDIWTIQYHQ